MEWIPKEGEIIEVRENSHGDWEHREFICISKDGKFLCWYGNKTDVLFWKYARPLDKFRKLKEFAKKHPKCRWECKNNDNAYWTQVVDNPDWTCDEYRIKDGIPLKAYEKFEDIIQAYWNGAKIEFWCDLEDKWTEADPPSWNLDRKYRVKSKTKTYYEVILRDSRTNGYRYNISGLLFTQEELDSSNEWYQKTGRKFEIEEQE
jgi:hypothetical protein